MFFTCNKARYCGTHSVLSHRLFICMFTCCLMSDMCKIQVLSSIFSAVCTSWSSYHVTRLLQYIIRVSAGTSVPHLYLRETMLHSLQGGISFCCCDLQFCKVCILGLGLAEILVLKYSCLSILEDY
jgi:hypothetical protein